MNRIDRYLNAAKKAADKSDFHGRVHVGCVAVYKNRIISRGYNSEKTNTLQKDYNKYRSFRDKPHSGIIAKLHAEVSCLHKIINMDIDWSSVDLYIYRKKRVAPFGLAKPCKGCMALIKSLGIRNIYYTGEGAIIHERVLYNDDYTF